MSSEVKALNIKLLKMELQRLLLATEMAWSIARQDALNDNTVISVRDMTEKMKPFKAINDATVAYAKEINRLLYLLSPTAEAPCPKSSKS